MTFDQKKAIIADADLCLLTNMGRKLRENTTIDEIIEENDEE